MAGIVSTIGINFGSVVAILIAAFGLSYLLELYPKALLIIQIVGGVFVMFLAIQIWPGGGSGRIEDECIAEENYSTLFRNGFVTSVLNPKDILFYTAFIPTFIPDGISGKSYQTKFLMLAVLYILIGFITKSVFAIFAGYARGAINSGKTIVLNYISSLILLFLGIYLLAKTLGQQIV